MQEKAKPVKVAFVLNPEESEVLEWQRKHLATNWARLGYLRDPTLADAARTLIHIAAYSLGYDRMKHPTPVDTEPLPDTSTDPNP